MKAEESKKIFVRMPHEERVWELTHLETSPCTLACPTRINARGYVSLVADGRFKEALALIRERNPFPGICGRICPRPCEAVCRRGDFDEPIAICALKRFVFDLEMKRGIDPAVPARIFRTEKVAVIGAGPAGLSAAHELAQLGYPVTIFEASQWPGGMMNLIPGYRLPQRVVRREIGTIIDEGITLVTGSVFGKDLTWRGLKRRGYQALLLATGAWKPVWGWGKTGMDGVVHALVFLTEAAERDRAAEVTEKAKRRKRSPVRRVVVAGDGMLALDAARTAVRSGYRSVKLLIGRSREAAPVGRSDLEAAIDEGVKVIFLARPIQLKRHGRKLVDVKCVKLQEGKPDAAGRRGIFEKEGSEFTVETDLFIDAFSRGVGIRRLRREIDLGLTPAGTVSVESETMAVNRGVFAAGDLVNGARSVVEAIASGQKAARGIHFYLSRDRTQSPFEDVLFSGVLQKEFALDRVPDSPVSQTRMPVEEARIRKKDFREVERGYMKTQAMLEAQRCLRCGTCAECAVCVDICDRKDIQLEVEDFALTVRADSGFWSRDPGTVVVEYGEEKAEARCVRTVCQVEPAYCIGCGRCEDICGYSAVRVESYPGGRFVARVHELACKGCGNCVAVCPTGAMNQRNFERQRLFEVLSKIEPSRTRVLFACRWARPEKGELPHHVLLIETMCSGRITPSLILEAVIRGSPGVMVCGCMGESCHYGFSRANSKKVVELSKNVLGLLGFDPALVSDSSCTPGNFHAAVRRWAGRKR